MKQRRISRFLAFVLLVAMTLSLMPATLAFAEEPSAEEYEGGTIRAVEVPEEDPEPYEPDPDEGSIRAVEDPVDVNAEGDAVWQQIDYADIVSGDTIAITMTKGDTTWVLPTAKTGKLPTADTTTLTNDTLGVASDSYGWTVEELTGGIALKGPDGYLNPGSDNNKLRSNGSSTAWTLDSEKGYLKAVDTGRYLGVYNNQDWRTYTTDPTTNNIKGQTLQLWKLGGGEPANPDAPAAPTASVPSGEVPAGTVVTFTSATEGAVISYSVDNGATWTEGNSYTVTEAVTIKVKATLNGVDSAVTSFVYTIPAELGTIAEALAGTAGTVYKVKGVVTFVDGKNVYVQDETGGICLYLPAADSSIQLGDTLIGTGAKKVFNGLPELDQAVIEKSEGLTLKAKETTLGALTDADICTYISLKNLTVTAIDGNNTTVKDETGGTINIFKAKADPALAVDDVINFTGVLGTYNGYQLRNTLASEITVISSAPQAPAAPVPSVAAGAVEAGTVVTFTSTTEGATVLLSVDDGATWEAPNPYTVNEAVTIKAKAVKDELESETVSFAYTIKVPEPTTNTIAEAIAGANGTTFTVKGVVTMVEGKNVYVQDETGGICLYLATADSSIQLGDTLIGTGSKSVYRGMPQLSSATAEKSDGLTLNAKETTIGALTTADVCTYVSLKQLTVTEVYDNNGAFSNPNITLKDADGATIQIYKAVIGKTDGAWDVKLDDVVNVKAAVGINNTTLQLRNTLATEIEPFVEVEEGLVTDLSTLRDGDTIVVYNPAYTKAMSETDVATYYRAGVDASVADNKIAGYDDTCVWTLGIKTEGDQTTYTFTSATGRVLTAGTRNSLPMGDANPDWTIEPAATEGCVYIRNAARPTQYIEWYASKTEFSAYLYAAANEGMYAMQLYRVTKTEPQPQPTGDDYGLASTLADGDTVILYNAKNGVALGNTISSHKVSGVSLTPVDGVITTDKTAVAWKVTVNADGTYTFTQGDYTLGGLVSGTYNNLVVTEATYTKWTLTGPDATDFNYFMYLGDMANNYGKTYLEYYNGFTLYGSTAPDKDAFGITFYKKGAEPETPAGPGETGDLVTSLDQLTEGATVAIYSPGHKTAISSKPNGDWYLKANDATIENGKVVNFTDDFVWNVKRNDNGTYSFYAYGDETRSITVWPSGNYAELSLNVGTYPENTWTLTPAKTANCFYISSPTVSGTSGPAYIEAYVRNEFEVFSGYFTNTNSNKFTESEFALQFYLVNPDDAIEAFDDGEWDGVLQKGGQYVAYNAAAESSIGLFAEANYSMRAIPTTIEGGKANAGNGAYVFTVDTMGRYYTFKIGDKFFATNNSEELFFADPNEDGSAPENAKWFLKQKENGYIIYNKDASYNGTPVCVEYYSSVFSGWTFSSKNDVNIYLFNFYEVADGTEIREGVVQDPSVIFACEDSRYVEQDYEGSFSLDDLADSITNISITYTAGERTGTVTEYEVSSDGKTYSFTIPADEIDGEEPPENFKIQVNVTNSFDISYTGEKTVAIIDEPFFTELTPAPNSQTREEKRPVISARIGNVGENPTIVMTVNDVEVEAVFENGVLSYTPAEDMADGRVAVAIQVKRADNVTAEKTWNFTVGYSAYQLYFGQLHSHTTYSDGSGDLDTALEYIASLPESANVQFVAFTDHSNYFDTTSAANPADALNDKTLMTEASRALWNEYKGKVASFNENHEDLLAIAGFEMTWSGGPGHINTFDSDGLVSRNNAELNSKTGDAGMKLYYETINKGDSLNQFNHPGNTFGNFTDFSYRDEATDAHMFLVEVGNGEGQIGAGGYYPSYEQYIMALDKGWHVAPTNNQDNHKGRWGNANDARDVILTDEFTEQGIYDAIRALRVYATEDKNLQITYSVNDMPMGTIFSDEDAPEKLNAVITLYDPDASDGISKVELVANGGVVAYTWNDAADLANGLLEAELDPEYSYYFVRVTQTDGDLAVTAPVWVGHAAKLGITDIKAASEQVYVNEETTLTTTLYNNEASAATVKSLVYTINGDQVIGSDTNAYTIPAGGTVEATFKHSFTLAKLTTVTVTAIVELDGKEYTYTANVELDLLDREHANEVTSIADVRAASDPEDTGYRFIIEGVITSNASGFDKDTAFFDCIYVQDETAGICCFPVSGEYKIGDKVRIVGHTDFYQGEPELQVKTLEVIGEGTVTPTEIKASELNDRSAEGKLVTVNGTVESFEVVNGLIQTIMVKDAEGDLARVFIDGYITTGAEVVGCVEGAQISATGLASYDDTFNAPEGPFPRIRIRNRADIICSEPVEPEPAVVVGKSLSLKGNIAVNFYLDLPQGVLSDDDAYVTINDVKYPVSEAEQSEVRAATGYRFTANVKFAHLTDTLVLRVYNGKDEPVQLKDSEGNDLTETGFAYRAQDYIEYIRANSEDEGLLAVVNALSDLGSLAQAQFKYNVDSRVDLVGDLASVTAEMVKDHELKLTTADGAGIRYYGSSLLLKDATTVRHYFKLDGGEIGDYTFTVDGAEVETAEKGGLYYVDITGIVARDLDKSFHVEVLKGGETVIGLDYSALSYAYTTLSRGKTDTLTELAKAVVLYSKAANAYLPE